MDLIIKYRDCLEANDCYNNALIIGRSESNEGADVTYILGVLGTEIDVCPHAWLSINGIEIDPTAGFFKASDEEYHVELAMPIAEAVKLNTNTISQMWDSKLDPRDYNKYDWTTSG
jgi:hypothetical protein